MAIGKQGWLEAQLDALFAYRLPQQLSVLLYKNGALSAQRAAVVVAPGGVRVAL